MPTHTALVAAFYVTLCWSGAMTRRFLGALVMRFVEPATLLAINAARAVGLILLSVVTTGHVALWSIVAVGLMNSIMFPTIFTLSIRGLGHLTQRESGLLIMAIVGGPVVPLLQAALADRYGLRIAFFIPAFCYLYVAYFASACRKLGNVR